jgi:hypothetical protein
VKAIVPLNWSEVLSSEESETAISLMEYLAADQVGREKIASNAKRKAWFGLLNNYETAKSALENLMEKARQSPKALSPLLAKYALAAILSAQSHAYVHLDIFTSASTHSAIQSELGRIRRDYRSILFTESQEVNNFIHQAIEGYSAASSLLNETHLIGYQEEVPPFDKQTREPLRVAGDGGLGTDEMLEEANGLGAGVGFTTLEIIGRSAQLEARGVRWGNFSNVEVLTLDVPAQLGAYLQLKKPVGLVVVETSDEFKGGAPYEVDLPSGPAIRLIERTDADNEIFNSNSIYYPIGASVPVRVDKEEKLSRRGTPMLLLRVNAGVITESHETGLILGRVGPDYQNVKKPTDYTRYGPTSVRAWRQEMEAQIGGGFAPSGR